jgi:hypothetical protein
MTQAKVRRWGWWLVVIWAVGVAVGLGRLLSHAESRLIQTATSSDMCAAVSRDQPTCVSAGFDSQRRE